MVFEIICWIVLCMSKWMMAENIVKGECSVKVCTSRFKSYIQNSCKWGGIKGKPAWEQFIEKTLKSVDTPESVWYYICESKSLPSEDALLEKEHSEPVSCSYQWYNAWNIVFNSGHRILRETDSFLGSRWKVIKVSENII